MKVSHAKQERPLSIPLCFLLAGWLLIVTQSPWTQSPWTQSPWTQSPLMAEDPSTTAGASLREPVSMALSPNGRWLYLVGRRSGAVHVVDTTKRVAVSELQIGERLSGLVRLDANRLAVVDEHAHELIILDVHADQLSVRQRLAVSSYPVSLVATRGGGRCFVASLWSRRVTEIETQPGQAARVARVIDMPLAPRNMLLVSDDTRLIVAASFAGRLGIIDTNRGELLGVRQFPSHNIRGLALGADGKMLLVAHQMLNELAHTVRNDVHWGLLMSNDLRWLPLEGVLEGAEDLYSGAHMHPLGDAGRAAGDPASVAVSSDGLVIVALAGVGEIALGKEDDFSLVRRDVGAHPVAVEIDNERGVAYIANQYSDSVSVVDLQQRKVVDEIRLGPMRGLSTVELGERLFHDARLSHDAWMSCHSCHTDGHTNGLLNDNFTDASFGAPKRVPTLLGVVDTGPYAWNATSSSIEGQIAKSIKATMQGRDLEPRRVDEIATYLRSLEPPPSIAAARGESDHDAARRGQKVFAEQRCSKCHQPPFYTTPQVYDVGLHDKEGNRRFNPPSLRGVSQRPPYFHDGSAETLEDVFSDFSHQIEEPLSDLQRSDLLAFLRSL